MPDVTAKVIDATGSAADKVARWTPTGVIQVLCMVLLAALLAVFGALLWMSQNREERRDRENREAFQSHTREANAREELRAHHCAEEAAKARRDNTEALKTIVTTILQEGERDRTFQREENAKLRAELVGAFKAKGQP